MDIFVFIQENWGEIAIALLALIKVIVNLTPTERDNVVFGYFDVLINLIVADRKKTPNN
jgi:hypothetical protein